MPGKFFHYEQAQSTNLPLYFGFYFCMTGLHGIHVLVGMGLIAWVLIRHLRGEFDLEYFTPVEGSEYFGTLWILFGFSSFRFFILWGDQ